MDEISFGMRETRVYDTNGHMVKAKLKANSATDKIEIIVAADLLGLEWIWAAPGAKVYYPAFSFCFPFVKAS